MVLSSPLTPWRAAPLLHTHCCEQVLLTSSCAAFGFVSSGVAPLSYAVPLGTTRSWEAEYRRVSAHFRRISAGLAGALTLGGGFLGKQLFSKLVEQRRTAAPLRCEQRLGPTRCCEIGEAVPMRVPHHATARRADRRERGRRGRRGHAGHARACGGWPAAEAHPHLSTPLLRMRELCALCAIAHCAVLDFIPAVYRRMLQHAL